MQDDCSIMELYKNTDPDEMRKIIKNLHLLLNSTAESIYSIDCQGRCTFINAAALQLLGYQRDDLMGINMHNIIHHSYADGTPYPIEECHIYQAFREGKDMYVDNEVVWRHDGSYCSVEYSSSPIIEDGKIKGAIVCFNDISRRQEIVEIALLNQKLAVSARRAGMAEHAASILHNIGNLLNSINVSMGLLHEYIYDNRLTNLVIATTMLQENINHLPDYLTQDAKGKLIPEYLISLSKNFIQEREEVKQEMQRLRENIKHIQDIVSMQETIAGTSACGKEKVRLSDVVESAIRMSGLILEKKDIHIQRDFKDSPLLHIDKSKLLQIIINLIQNAKDAILAKENNDSEKRISIKLAKQGDNKNYVDIIITDNGIGIDHANLEKIFSFGFTTKVEGHGFGLNSSAIAAKELGGQLQVNSDGVGKGATFTLSLPFIMVAEDVLV